MRTSTTTQKTTEDVKNYIKSINLTNDEQQILKDAIINGSWGDCDAEFIEDGEVVTKYAWGYFTNYKYRGGNYKGCIASFLFRMIYKKACERHYNGRSGIGEVIAFYNNWYDDGSADVLFIKDEWISAFDEWAAE